MSKYEFGYDNGGKNKDLQCVSLYNNETKEISLFFKEEDIAKQKDARIAELEKQLADKKETATYKNNFCVNCCKDKSGEQIICLKCHEEVCNAYKKQLAELEELKKNAIVPKFNFGDTIFAVVTYIDDTKDKTVIESGIVQKIDCDKNQIKYWCDNGRIYWEDECEKLFATEQEAQQKLKELEGLK